MSERDAFGRAREEDTLAGMGWREPTVHRHDRGSAARARTTLPPLVSCRRRRNCPPPRPAPLPAPAGARAHRRARPALRPALMTRVLFLGIVAASVLFALRSGAEHGSATSRTRSAGVQDGVARTVPVEGGSLLQASAFAAALKGLPAGDVEMLRLAPGALDAQVIVAGRRRSVRVTARGRVLDVPTPGGARVEPVRVDARAPARIVRTVTQRTGRRPASVSYLVLMRGGGRPQWQLFFKDGLHFSASAGGAASAESANRAGTRRRRN